MTRLFVPNIADITQPGALLGYLPKSGRPVYLQAGGAPANVDEWIPIEYDSDVVQRVQMESAIERYAARIPMRSKTKSVPRSAGMSVSAGTTYTDDASTNDEVTLTARRFHARFKVDEDDLADAETRMDVIGAKGLDWAISYADAFDNACLATTGAENGTTRPFTSVYQTLRTNDSDVSYTADTNYNTWDDDSPKILSSPDGTSLYEKLNETFRRVEVGKFWNQADALVIAAPGWRSALRLAMDGNGAPIFKESAGIDSVTQRPFDTLFNTRIAWSRGAKLSATNTDAPAGADLLFFVNARYLKRGDRSGPETLTDTARAQDDTDDYAVKFRARRGFRLTMPQAASVLERVD